MSKGDFFDEVDEVIIDEDIQELPEDEDDLFDDNMDEVFGDAEGEEEPKDDYDINDEEDDSFDDTIFGDITAKKERLRKKKITIPVLTNYERTKMLSIRSQQIMNNSPILVDINDVEEKTPYYIALEELKQKKIPFKIKRPLPDNTYEIWHISEFKKIFT